MRFVSIASGSSGNCIYIGTDDSHILIDAGISNRRIEQGLNELGIKAEELTGILITHEHSDHICGLNTFMKKHPVPLYGTEETLEKIVSAGKGMIPEEYLTPICPEQIFAMGDMEVHPFGISHDAANPVAYRVQSEKASCAVATDLGEYTARTVEMLQHLDGLLLESNHDIHMLETGPYPYYLKQRILGSRGHLSNENAGRLLSEVMHDGLKFIRLGHISKENNYPELAYEAVRLEIDMAANPYFSRDFDIQVASRTEMSEILNL